MYLDIFVNEKLKLKLKSQLKSIAQLCLESVRPTPNVMLAPCRVSVFLARHWHAYRFRRRANATASEAMTI